MIDTAQTNTVHIDNTIPALTCQLQGGYLIEASAGTGKTWTLTGILLRLLIEHKTPPERIVATTFTRAAAAEMQERLQQRLSEFYTYLQWLIRQRGMHPEWFNPDVDRMDAIVHNAAQAGIIGYDDPINVYLIRHLLADIDDAITTTLRRILVLLTTLDKLFIGTLDSLAQKWLKEFRAEIGSPVELTISPDAQELIGSLIHDELRAAHYRAYANPRLYQLIDRSIFGDIDSAIKAVNVALQFYTAPIDECLLPDEDYLNTIEIRLSRLAQIDYSVFAPYYDFDNAKKLGMKANSKVAELFGRFPHILSIITEHKIGFINYLSDRDINWLDKINNLDIRKLFKKGYEKNAEELANSNIYDIIGIADIYKELKGFSEYYRAALYRYIANKIRIKLKTTLEAQAQSTFIFEMVRLNEALEQIPTLVRHIRHHYPVALIDESQDINGLQAEMIRHIYLTPMLKDRDAKRKPYGFLLLVGDPKQAIYRFRGGDVANYNYIKNYPNKQNPILDSSLSLIQNRRSISTMIDTLNSWFEDNKQDGRENHAYLGDDIYYDNIITNKNEIKISWQYNDVHDDYIDDKSVSILYHDPDNDIYNLIAQHINSLLQGNHTLNGKKIRQSDIAILAKSKAELNNIKLSLDRYQIKSVIPDSVNVFSARAGLDMYMLLSSVFNPQNNEIIGALLTSGLFGLSLDDVNQLMKCRDNNSHLMIYLNYAKMNYQRYGISSCLNYLMSHYPFGEYDSLWQSGARSGERYLTDIWQLIDLISRYATLHKNYHEIHLLTWLKKMCDGRDESDIYQRIDLPSEIGVNLFTIHRSKGLQFPIVYVMGLHKSPKENIDPIFYLYSDEENKRRISPIRHKDGSDYKALDIDEQLDELRRLGYVALTRAEDQLFVVANQVKQKSGLDKRPLYQWLDNDVVTLSLPDRLVGKAGWINIDNSKDMVTTLYKNQDSKPNKISYYAWDSVYKNTNFYGASKTSATALMRQLVHNDQINHRIDTKDEPIYDGMFLVSMPDNKIRYQPNDIRRNFEKGVNTGIFLHHILEHSSPKSNASLSLNINTAIKKYNFFDKYHSDNKDLHHSLIIWIKSILSTPMTTGISIEDIYKNRQYDNELKFVLGIDESFNLNKLNTLIHKYSDKPISLDTTNDEIIYKYLQGEIDFVYEYMGKYYVVDFKSNYIGDFLGNYHADNLSIIMDKSGYWLQALIYQVALHRLLRLRIADYCGREHDYLGAVEFIFLRGVDSDDRQLGRISWNIPIDLVLSIDKIFSQNME